MRHFACLLLLVLAACAPAAGSWQPPAQVGQAAPPADPYSALGEAQATAQRAQQAIGATQQAQAATVQAVTVEARQTLDALRYQQTAQAATQAAAIAGQTQAAHVTAAQNTQVALSLTQVSGRITQAAEIARATEDWRLSGIALQNKENAAILAATQTAQAAEGAARVEAAMNAGKSILIVGGSTALAFALWAVAWAWRKRLKYISEWAVFPRDKPTMLIHLPSGRRYPLVDLPTPRLPQQVERPVPYNVANQGTGNRDEDYGPQRLLLDAAQVVGWQSADMPGWRELPQGWTSGRWQNATRQWNADGILIAEPGKGTRLNTERYRSLADLFHDVLRQARQAAHSPTGD